MVRTLVILALVHALAWSAIGQVMPAPTGDEAPGKNDPRPRGPGNNNCLSPQPINGQQVVIPFFTGQFTTGLEGQMNAACLSGGTTGIANDAWFVWIAPISGVATLQSCGLTSVNTKAAVYVGVGCPQTPPIACADNSCGQQTALSFQVTAGEMYTLQLGKAPGSPDGLAEFMLSAKSSGPNNDDCVNAVSVGEGQFPFDLGNATPDGPPGCAQFAADVWFRYTATGPGLVTVRTCGSAPFDTALSVYTGACGALTEVACNDNACGLQSIVFFDAQPGQQFLVRVGSNGPDAGTGGIVIARGPPCVQDCPPGFTPEGEPCGEDTNGGCSTNQRYITLECDVVICGSVFADAGIRDADWYRFVLSGPRTVSVALTGELPVAVFLLEFSAECGPAEVFGAADTLPCEEPGVLSVDLPPGVYSVVVVPGRVNTPIFDGFPCGGRNGYTLEVGFGVRCPEDNEFFGGLLHTSIGVAQLTPGSVIVSNTGGGGANGVSVQVGETAEGWRTTGLVPPGALPVGASLVGAATGTVDGRPDNTIAVARLDSTPGQRLRVTPDFSPIGVSTYTLRAFNGPTMVFEGSGRTGPAFDRANNGLVRRMTFACAPEGCETPPCAQVGPFVPVLEFAFPTPGTYQIIGGPSVSADRFVIIPEGLAASVTSVSETALTIANITAVTLEEESLVFRRLFHTALGQTRFDASGGELGLGNMSMSGGDGVTIELDPRTGHYVAELEPLGDPADPANPIQDGAFIEYIARGIVNGVPETVYSTSRYTDVGPELECTFDFSPTGTDTLQIVYLVGNMVVAAESLAGSAATFSADDWVLTLEKTYDSCGRVVCQRPCWAPAASIGSPSGAMFSAEVLEVIAIDPTETFTGYTSADILFSGIGQARIVRETVEYRAECCACDFNLSGQLNSQDFFDFLTCFFGGMCVPGRTPDFNADQAVNSQDFFDFLTCFFAPPAGCN